MSKNEIVAIHVWRSYHCATDYSISLVDSEGGEVECLGGDNDVDDACTYACEVADARRLPVMLMPDESGRITWEYRPDESDEPGENESDEDEDEADEP
ncbi:MAG TPA: hypothetical protein VMN56_01395 [Casimicrobiaceae bacterium]|nr:hypothetical protein [Casimicrobiaceae bacterium]